MKPTIRPTAFFALVLMVTTLFAPLEGLAQRSNRGGGGGGKPAARPAASRPTINGGAQRSPDRAVKTPTAMSAPSRPAGGASGGSVSDRKPGGSGGSGNTADRKPGGDGNRTSVKGGDKVNIGSGNTNVNINVDNSRNTTVRRNNNIHYNRPPYRYGGHSYYCYHPYHYHPYRPFYWGPMWHPWGFVVATMAATAIIVSVNSQQYHYDQGVFYTPTSGGYTVVAAPVGATVQTIPSSSQTVIVNETTNNYYYGGTYYEKSGEGYTVMPPTAGCVVESLPEGGEEVKIGDQTYVKVGETYYQPIEKDGKSLYEVVDVREGE